MKNKKFIVGSKAFFANIKGFVSKDTDLLIFEENPVGYKYNKQICLKNTCNFFWRLLPKDEMIAYVLQHSDDAMIVGKFLVPDVARFLDFTIEDLKKFENVFDKIDDKHTYERIIYDAYIQNNDFVLTDEQLNLAYEEYKLKRQ